MNRVFTNRLGKLGANRARSGIGRVGRPHDFAVLADGAFAFQNLHDNWPRCHEFAQFVIERARGVHDIELAGLFLGQVKALLRHDPQACILELGVDLAGQIALGRVGFDDRKGALNGHCVCLHVFRGGPAPRLQLRRPASMGRIR